MSGLDSRELAAVLAGLRLLQREIERDQSSGVQEILTDAGEPLSLVEIDRLCERLNTAPDGSVTGTVTVLAVEHRHGVDHWVCDNEETAWNHLHQYVKDWWTHGLGEEPMPDNPDEAIERYFEVVQDESYLIQTLPILRAPAVPAPAGMRVYTVVEVHGGLVCDVGAFTTEAAAQASIDDRVVRAEIDVLVDTGVTAPEIDGGTVRHAYRALDGRTREATVVEEAETEDELYLEETTLSPHPDAASPHGSTRIRHVAW